MAVSQTSAAPTGLGAIPNMATGSFTCPATATDISIVLGFNPRYFKAFVEGSDVQWEKVQGDLPANTWKHASGGTTLDTTGAVTFPADTGLNEPGSSVYMLAAICPAGAVISWMALG